MLVETVFADTNLFLRFLTNDVPALADQVEMLLRSAAQDQIQLVTTSMVIAEIVWTLESFYRLDKKVIESHLLAILNTPGLDVVDSDLVLQAVGWYAEKNVDFIDAFNAAWMLKNGIETALTFDQKHFNRFEGINAKAP